MHELLLQNKSDRIFMRFPEEKVKALTLSYDDGVEADVRLLKIMRQNGLKGTFNLNSGRYATNMEICNYVKTFNQIILNKILCLH